MYMLLFYKTLLTHLVLEHSSSCSDIQAMELIIVHMLQRQALRKYRLVSFPPWKQCTSPMWCIISFPNLQLLQSLLVLLLLLAIITTPNLNLDSSPTPWWEAQIALGMCMCVHQASMPTAQHAHTLPPTEAVVLSPYLAYLSCSYTYLIVPSHINTIKGLWP